MEAIARSCSVEHNGSKWRRESGMTTPKPRDSIARKREATKAKRSMASFHQVQQSSSSSSSFLHLPHDRLAFPFSQHLIEQEPVHDPALDSVGSRCAGCTTLSSPRRLDQRKEGRKEGGREGRTKSEDVEIPTCIVCAEARLRRQRQAEKGGGEAAVERGKGNLGCTKLRVGVRHAAPCMHFTRPRLR